MDRPTVAPRTGWLVGDSGEPVAGAEVQAEANIRTEPAGAAPDSATVSGADGSFTLDSTRPDGAYRLLVDATGYARSVHLLPPSYRSAGADPERIVLTRGEQVRGKVVDADGRPVEGAHVRLRWPRKDQKHTWLLKAEDAAEMVTTGTDGEFQFPRVESGQYSLRIWHEDHVKLHGRRVDVVDSDDIVDIGTFTLTRGSEIFGTVTEAGGSPAAGVTVSVDHSPWFERGQIPPATTDEHGAFRLTGLAPEPTDLILAIDDEPVSALPDVRPDAREPLVIELPERSSLALFVVDQQGRPAADASVFLAPSHELMMKTRRPITTELFRQTQTGSDGRLRFDHLLSGAWNVETERASEEAAIEEVLLEAGKLREIELVLESRDSLAPTVVAVTDDADRPVPGATIHFWPEGQGHTFRFTDAGGVVAIPLETGATTIAVSHPKHADVFREVLVEADENHVSIQLEPGLEIAGSIRAPDGTLLTFAEVEARALQTETGEPGSEAVNEQPARYEAARAVTTGSGQFRLVGLIPGRYLVTAQAPGFSRTRRPEPIVLDDGSVAGIDIVLDPGGSVAGIVTGLPPADLARTNVTLASPEEVREPELDVAGRFAVHGLTPGEWSVRATVGGIESTRYAEDLLTIEPGTFETFIELPFPARFR